MPILLIISLPVLAALLSFAPRRKIWPLTAIALCASLVELIASLMIANHVLDAGSYAFSAYFLAQPLGALLAVLIAIVGTAIMIYSFGYFEREVAKEIIGFRRVRQYYILVQLFMAAMYIAVLSASPVIMWMAIEATTLSSVFLVSFYNKPGTIEAAWKYLIINSVGLLLGFFGMLLFFSGFANSANINWQTFSTHTFLLDPTMAKMAFAFVLIGYGTKMGLVPMHTWLPDAHSKAPIPVSSLLSGLLLNIALYAILRFKVITDAVVGVHFTSTLLIVFGVLSVTVAAFMILAQKNYKRLLAYSSIEHMGLIALGFGLGGVATFAAVLHLIYHTLTKTILFLSAGNIFLQYSSTKIAAVRGMRRALPITTVLFVMGALAITGTPPFGTFVTEFSILAASMHRYPWVAVIVLIALSIVFIGFLTHLSDMLPGEPPTEVGRVTKSLWRLLPIMTLLVILVGLSIHLPQPVFLLIERIANH